VVARVGVEEFALIAPELTVDQGRWVAEKLRVLIERTPCRFEDQGIPITVSFGVAELGASPPMGPTELYQNADERLYAAKRGGRNRVA
jgi:diguanylate cyclase (GGDEF)-like protein